MKESKHGVKTLNKRNIYKIIEQNPTINSFQELCAFWGVDEEDISEESKALAEKIINRKITLLRVQLKNELLKGNNNKYKEHEMLYKLIGTDEEIKRLKSAERTATINNNNTTVKPTIQIQSFDEDIQNKLLEL